MSDKEDVREKRERQRNYTEEEVEVLVGLLMKYKKTITDRLTNTIANRKKDKAWRTIEYEFNKKIDNRYGSNAYRSAKHLRCKFDMLKKNIKKRNADFTNLSPLTSTEKKINYLILHGTGDSDQIGSDDENDEHGTGPDTTEEIIVVERIDENSDSSLHEDFFSENLVNIKEEMINGLDDDDSHILDDETQQRTTKEWSPIRIKKKYEMSNNIHKTSTEDIGKLELEHKKKMWAGEEKNMILKNKILEAELLLRNKEIELVNIKLKRAKSIGDS